MRLSDCDKDEITTLVALVALAQPVFGEPGWIPPIPRELGKYTQAIGEIRERYFGVRGRQRYMAPRGFIDGHETRVTPRWR